MLLPVQSVGVMGDGRTYENVIAIRAVQTDDYMTADWSHLPYELLAQISTRIINQVSASIASSTTSAASRRRRLNGNKKWSVASGQCSVASYVQTRSNHGTLATAHWPLFPINRRP